MAYKQSVINAVRGAYVYKCLALEGAANESGVPYGTARTWKTKAKAKGDDWDTARNAARMAQGGMGDLTNQLIEQFALQADALMSTLADKDNPVSPSEQVNIMAKLSDSYTKLVAAAGKSGSKVAPLATAMRVVKMLGDFIHSECPQHASIFIEILEPFGHVLAEELG